MAKFYNLIVIGSGTAAHTVAMEVRANGWTVAVVDYRPPGGTCALRGCDPKKIMISGARALDQARRMEGRGVGGDSALEWAKLLAYKEAYTEAIPGARRQAYDKKNIDYYPGRASFVGPSRITVNDQKLEAEYIVIASGAEPVELAIPGAEHLITSEEFLNLPSLPRRLVFVGGGYIAAELSHLATRAGAQVTIVQRAPRLLKHFDPQLVDWLMEAFSRQGIDVITQAGVDAVEKTDDAYTVHISSGRFSDRLTADLVVHAAGRAPALSELNLEAGGIETDKGRLVLSDFLQSRSNPAVFAAGDAAQKGPPLTPVSSHDAQVVAANILQGTHRRPDYQGIPSVAFSIPPIASVGMSEAEARGRELNFQLMCGKTSDWFSAYESAEPVAGFKILIDDGHRRILGAHLLGPRADEQINLFALAIRHGLTADQLRGTLFAYPTGASDLAAMIGG